MAKVVSIEASAPQVFFFMDDNTIKMHGSAPGHGLIGPLDQIEILSPSLGINAADVKQISTYEYSTFYLMKDGTVKACGHDEFGELGLGAKGRVASTPTLIPNLTGVKQISTGKYNTLFLMEDGTVKGCGWNAYSQLGIIHIGGTSPTNILTPTLISGLAGVKQASIIFDTTTLYLMEDGTVKGIGDIKFGTGGSGYGVQVPTLIPNLTEVKQISEQFFLLNDGSVKIFGYNNNGYLGTGDRIARTVPTLHPEITRAKQIVSTSHSTFVLMEDGTVKACGDNAGSQLGIGNSVSNPSVELMTLVPNLTGVKQISGNLHGRVFYLMEDGTVKACGSVGKGLIDTFSSTTTIPVPVINLCTVDNFYLYLQGAKAYAEQNGSLVKVADDYTVLTDTEKKLLFESANSELAPVEQLNTLNKFKILRCSTESKNLTCNITAVPQLTRIEPSTLLTINNVGISKVALEAQGICKVYVTTDLATYKSFDFVTRTWSSTSQGIDAAELPNITLNEWDALLQSGNQIAFAYELDLLATQDISHVADLTITTYLHNEWAMALPGTDYKYSYPKGDTLRVSLLTSGDYKINYQA